LIDFDAVLVGKGNLEVSRGMPVGRGIPLAGRVDVLGCPSILAFQLLMLVFGQGESHVKKFG
jgi:hypothetical protein